MNPTAILQELYCTECDGVEECDFDTCECAECVDSHDHDCLCDGCTDRRVDYAESLRDAYD